MQALEEYRLSCPYCGELIDLLIDQSIGEHEAIEDCQVCCRPIVLQVSYSENDQAVVTVRQENE